MSEQNESNEPNVPKMNLVDIDNENPSFKVIATYNLKRINEAVADNAKLREGGEAVIAAIEDVIAEKPPGTVDADGRGLAAVLGNVAMAMIMVGNETGYNLQQLFGQAAKAARVAVDLAPLGDIPATCHAFYNDGTLTIEFREAALAMRELVLASGMTLDEYEAAHKAYKAMVEQAGGADAVAARIDATVGPQTPQEIIDKLFGDLGLTRSPTTPPTETVVEPKKNDDPGVGGDKAA